MLRLTREEKLAHADQLFDMVWPADNSRAAALALETATDDLWGWIYQLERDPNNVPVAAIAGALREIAARLESIEIPERVA